METDAESFCCAEADEFYEELFEGKLTLCVFFNVKLNAILSQDIYCNKLSLRLIWLRWFAWLKLIYFFMD